MACIEQMQGKVTFFFIFVFCSSFLFLLCCKLKAKDELVANLKREPEENGKQHEELAKVS